MNVVIQKGSTKARKQATAEYDVALHYNLSSGIMHACIKSIASKAKKQRGSIMF